MSWVQVRLAGCWFGLLAIALLGCLRTFGPDLRPRGVHAELPAASPNAMCMGCHESEADALARMHANAHHGVASTPPSGSEPPPLVADWMITAAQPCTHCHRIRVDD